MLRKDKAAPGWYPAAAQGNAFTKHYSGCTGCGTPGPTLCRNCQAWTATAFYLRRANAALKGTV